MKKYFFLITLILSISLFASCDGAHKSKAKKMLAAHNETECSSIVSKIESLVLDDSQYKWNGEKMELKIDGELKNELEKLISFHNANHKFSDDEWNDWMYYYTLPEKRGPDCLTSCLVCYNRYYQVDIDKFDSDPSFDTEILKILLGKTRLVDEKEKDLTENHYTRYLIGTMVSYDTVMYSIVDLRNGTFPANKITTNMNNLWEGYAFDLSNLDPITIERLKIFFTDDRIYNRFLSGEIFLYHHVYNNFTDKDPVSYEEVETMEEFIKYLP